jgi:tRNA pseudouridine32 synthase/23S rRNA pseudouridine746 synthase/23S rRNA pseudouridine1911/1915/1917 synthase
MIDFNQENASLLEALMRLSPESSKSTLRSWLKEGRVAVDGKTIKNGSTLVQKGQSIKISPKTPFTKGGIRILYEDSHLIVIEKPEGLLSVSTPFEKGKTAHAFLKEKYRPRKVYVVHRLDQETSGVMLFALTEKACRLLKDTFERHDIERVYWAIIEGAIVPPTGTWSSYLWEDSSYYVHSTSDSEKGQLAVTHYKVKVSSKHYSWLELKLETGRKNQIRVHCQDAGHPVVGDRKYGARTNPIKRLCLHAHTLAFRHPMTGKKMHFTSDPPETFFLTQSMREGFRA